MLPLLFLIPLYPHVSRFFFTLNNCIQICNLFIKLFFGKFKLTLNTLLLCIELLIIPLKLDASFIKFIKLCLFTKQSLIIHFQDLTSTFLFLDSLRQFNFSLMPYLVRYMKLLCDILQILECSLLLLQILIIMNLQGSQLQ